MINIFTKNYTLPTLRTYEVSDFDRKYYKPKALEKLVEKRNLEYKRDYDNRMDKYNGCVKTITQKLDPLPSEIKDLFRRVLGQQVEYVDRTHQLYVDTKLELEKEYDKKPVQNSPSAFDLLTNLLCYYIKMRPGGKYNLVNPEEILQRYPNLKDYDFDKMYMDFKRFKKIESHDLVVRYGSVQEAKNFVLQDIISRLGDISSQIKRAFNGNYPTTCITDVNFGAGGHFNGILQSGDIKLSFKSFIAGGYNIQREHIRFKITKLVR